MPAANTGANSLPGAQSVTLVRQELFRRSPYFEPHSEHRFSKSNLIAWKPLRSVSEVAIEMELRKLLAEGLVESFSKTADTGEVTLRSTYQGWVAREEWLISRGLRYAPLRTIQAEQIPDVALACVVAAQIRSERTPPGYFGGEGSISRDVLSFYLQRPVSPDIEDIVGIFERQGYVRTTRQNAILATAFGRRYYEQVVASTLGVPPEAAILDLQSIGDASLFQIGLPQDLADNIWSRWVEAGRCLSCGAHLAATIMYASVTEGVLEFLLRERGDEAAKAKAVPKERNGKPKSVDRWRLVDMVDVAKELRCLDPTLAGFVDALRDIRNLVHPRKQLESGAVVDERVARIARSVAEGAVESIERRRRTQN